MTHTKATPRRPFRLRFSLKLFLAAVAVLAGAIAWTAARARAQKEAVAAIQSVGGTVLFDYHQTGPRSWSSGGTPRGPGWVRDLVGPEYFDRAVYVSLVNTPADDRWIAGVNNLGTVETLLLSGKNVTDETLKELDSSELLQELHLSGSAVTDAGFGELQKFPKLRWLVANETPISDRVLGALVGLPELEELNIRGTRISDAAVAAMCDLSNLQKLDVRDTAISNEGAERLKAALPDTRVMH